MSDDDGPPPRSAFFGRSRGHRLRERGQRLVEELLPKLRVPLQAPLADARAIFAQDVSDVWLEIGFGGGEHLVATARRETSIGIIGCEPFLNGTAKVLSAVDQHDRAAELPLAPRLRLHDRDAVPLLAALPTGSIGRVFVLYPDPWPKRRQRKRRLLSDATLLALARLMRPGAELRFATDIDDYAAWVLARVLRSADFEWPARRATDWSMAWPDWPGTRYEKKALAEGRRPIYLTFRRR